LTKKLKKQLSSFTLLPIVIVFIFLVVFFIYSIKFNNHFFVVILATQFVILVFLIFFRNRFLQQKTVYDLQEEDRLEEINLLCSKVEKEDFNKESLKVRFEDYSKLKILAEKLSLSETRLEAANVLTEQADELIGKNDATTILYLLDLETGEPSMISSVHNKAKVNVKSKKGDYLDRWVLKKLKPLLVEDIKSDFRFDTTQGISKDGGREKRSLISIPLVLGEKILGVLRVDSPNEKRFSMEDLRLLSRIGDLGAVAMESAYLYERIQDLAVKDSLTGLYLRRFLMDRLNSELPRELRSKSDLSLLVVDLDYFKKYNDQFGHIAGDMVLKKLSEHLVDIFNNPGDIICRYGGEEFVVMLPDCTKIQAKKLAEDLRKKVEETKIILRREKTKVTVSIGVATFPTDAQIKEELIHKADQAMYQAKRKGRNKVCLS